MWFNYFMKEQLRKQSLELRKTLPKLTEKNLIKKDALKFTQNLEEKYKQVWNKFINSP